MKSQRMIDFVIVVFTLILGGCFGDLPGSGKDALDSGVQFTITGDSQYTMYITSSLVTIEEADGEQFLQLYFAEYGDLVVFFLLPTNSQAGEYTIGSGGIDAIYLDNSGNANFFFDGISGTLTLTEAGAAFSGSFQFAAEQSDLNIDSPKSVNVSGSFSNVPRCVKMKAPKDKGLISCTQLPEF